MAKYNIDDLKMEYKELIQEETIIKERKIFLLNKLKEDNLYINKKNEIQEQEPIEKVWGIDVDYSYLSKYLSESPYQWLKYKGEGIIEIDFKIVKDIVAHLKDRKYIINIIEDIIKSNFKYAYGNISYHYMNVYDGNTKINIDKVDLNSIVISEDFSVDFEADESKELEEFECLHFSISKVCKKDCRVKEKNNVLED